MPIRSTRPALALGVVLTLAAGVGALTAAFGLVHAALFRQPPFPEADRLAMLHMVRHPTGEPERRERWSFARFQLLESRQQSFELVARYTAPSLTLSGEHEAELVRGEMVSAGYFPLLRVVPFRGRLFGRDEESVERPSRVALVSHALWQRRWAGDAGLLGREIRVNGVGLTVIGILPAGFHGLSGRADLWLPGTMAPAINYADYVRTNQNFISAVGRLRPGVSIASARTELAVLGAAINQALPSDERQPLEPASATAVTLNEARSDPRIRRSLWVLLGAVAVLHLLAAANVTNLLLGRAARRRREGAVRLALGSSPGRLFRHLLAADLRLAFPGALLGVLGAALLSGRLTPPVNAWSGRNFYGAVAPFDAPAFGATELGFGIGLAAITALLVALPAALTAFRLNVQSGIRSGSQAIAGGVLALRRPGLRGALVAMEAALAVLLVLSAGLLIDSFRRMRNTELGVNPTGVLTFWIIASEARVPPSQAGQYVARLLDEMQRVPGVVSATVDGGAPLAGTARGTLFVVGRPVPAPSEAPPVLRHYVGPDHFKTLEIPVLRGRPLGPGDGPGAPKVTVISEAAARRFWPDQDPIGQRVWFSGNTAFGSADSSAEIVGIVGDVMYEPLDRSPNQASFYTSFAQFTYPARMFFLRTNGAPAGLVPQVRAALRRVDPNVAMQDVQTLEEVISSSWARSRFEAVLFGGFGGAALLLAASGIFAVLAYVVAGRTREFGIRIALGADTPRVMRTVIAEGLVFPVLGMVIGVAASVAATRVLRASLYEVSPLEPGVFVVTIALLLAAAVVACLIPAARATRASPLEAIRAE